MWACYGHVASFSRIERLSDKDWRGPLNRELQLGDRAGGASGVTEFELKLAGRADHAVVVLSYPAVQGHEGPAESKHMPWVNCAGHQTAWQRAHLHRVIIRQDRVQGHGQFNIRVDAIVMH